MARLLIAVIIFVKLALALPSVMVGRNEPLALSGFSQDTEPSLTQPNEVLPIQPLLVYPKSNRIQLKERKLDFDANIIYIKLLRRQQYRPKMRNNVEEPDLTTNKDIFFVKALTNGRFWIDQLKVYRLPEFYEIRIYHKPESSGPI